MNRGFFIFIFIAPAKGRKLPNVYKKICSLNEKCKHFDAFFFTLKHKKLFLAAYLRIPKGQTPKFNSKFLTVSYHIKFHFKTLPFATGLSNSKAKKYYHRFIELSEWEQYT